MENLILLVVLTCAMVAVLLTRRSRVRALAKDHELGMPPPPPPRSYGDPASLPYREGPTAVLLVRGYTKAGLAMLQDLAETFAGYYRNILFLSILTPSEDETPGSEGTERLRRRGLHSLDDYLAITRLLGVHAEGRCAVGLADLAGVCHEILRTNPRPCFFLARAFRSANEPLTWTTGRELAEQVRRQFVRDGIPFIETAVDAGDRNFASRFDEWIDRLSRGTLSSDPPPRRADSKA
jgi:hypothetical protein